MQISVAAYKGYPSDSTISLLLSFPGATAIALADTGSTNTFLDHTFAVKHNISITPVRKRIAMVAGGGTLISEAIAYNCEFSIQGHKFSSDFRILELQGSDVILGVNWFKKYNPVTFDFVERTLTMALNGTPHTFQDHLMPKAALFISSAQCNQLIQQGAECYLICNTTNEMAQAQQTEETNSDSVPHYLTELLQQFQDIFQSPKGLPPRRDCDHQIPLIPGAKPPNIRPYRMSHDQKNSVEQIIQEMLKNSEIRISASPFSSLQ